MNSAETRTQIITVNDTIDPEIVDVADYELAAALRTARFFRRRHGQIIALQVEVSIQILVLTKGAVPMDLLNTGNTPLRLKMTVTIQLQKPH